MKAESPHKFGRSLRLCRSISLCIALLTIALICNGCATLYVSSLRDEFDNTNRIARGCYGSKDVYPSLYHSTYIAATVEIPLWMSATDDTLDGAYVKKFRWLGLPCALLDIPCSIITDTIMLPLDAYCIFANWRSNGC